jgi:endonuclease-8
VIETPRAVAVCFDAPTVELLETRALALHPALRSLGSDATTVDFDIDSTMRALRDQARANVAVGDALLDQRAVAGFGNVYRSELPFIERLSPFTAVADVSDEQLRRMLERGAQLLRANSRGGARVTTAPGTPARTYVYGRTGRPCLRCGALIKSAVTRSPVHDNPRRVYWCPSCQPPFNAKFNANGPT